jgi:hypothetical protein
MKNWGAYPHEDSVLEELLLEIDNTLGVGVLEKSLNELAVLSDEVKCSKEASDSTLSKAIVLREKVCHAFAHDFLHLLDVADNILLNHILHGLVPCNATHWMGLVGCAPSNRIRPEEILNFFSEPDC